MSVLHTPTTAEVLLFYAGESLKDQIFLWWRRHSRRRVRTSVERSLPEIRSLLRHAGSVIVDATVDPSQATDAFLQAVAKLGPAAVAVYSEKEHDGLELFVRMQGSLYFAGPLLEEHWNDFFQRFLPAQSAPPGGAYAWMPPHHFPPKRRRFSDRFRDQLGYPFNDIDLDEYP